MIKISSSQETVELVARIRAGDPGAEADLIRHYDRGVSIIIRKHGGGPAYQDLYQKTFLLALEKIRLGEVREPEKLRGFISGLARNLTLDYLGQANRDRQRETEVADSLTDAGPSPYDQLLRKEKAQLVRQVLAKLKSPRDREVLARFYLAEEDKQQICADLGLTSLQFNLVLFRAHQRYKALYQKLVGQT